MRTAARYHRRLRPSLFKPVFAAVIAAASALSPSPQERNPHERTRHAAMAGMGDVSTVLGDPTGTLARRDAPSDHDPARDPAHEAP